ncbi:hypothetical protein L208DRAFT_1403436 [Tricholoma matsutake]|nr:hypothetical protein L208DRAFT_1403436 [Tricholoma matsutake 945]
MELSAPYAEFLATTVNQPQCTDCLLPGFVLSQGKCVSSCHPAGIFIQGVNTYRGNHLLSDSRLTFP